MHDEDDLRRVLGAAQARGRIDVDAVVRRARARRRPKRVAVGAVGALAVLGIGVVAVPSWLPPQQDAVVMSQPESDAGASPESATESGEATDTALRVAADALNRCGGPLAAPVENAVGLTLAVRVPAAVMTGDEIAATLVLTNSGAAPVNGTTATVPDVALARDGIVVWHTPRAAVAEVEVHLQPGEQLELPVTLHALECVSEERLRTGSELDPVPPGDYQVSVALDVATDAVDRFGPVVALVVAPPASITIE